MIVRAAPLPLLREPDMALDFHQLRDQERVKLRVSSWTSEASSLNSRVEGAEAGGIVAAATEPFVVLFFRKDRHRRPCAPAYTSAQPANTSGAACQTSFRHFQSPAVIKTIAITPTR